MNILACALVSLLILFASSAFIVVWSGVKLEDIGSVAAIQSCNANPIFTTESMNINQSKNIALPITLTGDAWLKTYMCAAGYIELNATGFKANGQWPILSIISNNRVVNEIMVSGNKNLNIWIDEPGKTIIGFFNNYYRYESRGVSMFSLKFRNSQCSSFTVDLPPASGGSWFPLESSASLLYKTPMTVKPCRAGRFSFLLSGSKALGSFGTIKVKRPNFQDMLILASKYPKSVSFQTSEMPFTIELLNPYYKVAELRRILLTKAKFTNSDSDTTSGGVAK